MGYVASGTNLYRYVRNNPTRAVDPSGLAESAPSPWEVPSAEMNVPHVFKYDLPKSGIVAEKDTIFKLIAKINRTSDGYSLTIRVDEGAMFRVYGTSNKWPFQAVVSGLAFGSKEAVGSNESYRDTDSIQVAVLYTDDKGNYVGHRTNAVPVTSPPRKMGAEWDFGGNPKDPGTQWASWTRDMPKSATRMNIIVMYTDTCFGSTNLPLVIGSFSGTLKTGGNWEIQANPSDVFKARKYNTTGGEPPNTEVPGLFAEAKKTLERKTGFTLRARPAGYTPENPTKDARGGALAVGTDGDPKRGILPTINNSADTGYDIVWPWGTALFPFPH